MPDPEDNAIELFGFPPREEALPAIRKELNRAISAEALEQGSVDTELMRLYCIQLFFAGDPGDAVLIWRAKTASWEESFFGERETQVTQC